VKPSGTNSAPHRSSASTTLWLVRHAEVEERYQAVFGGRIDMELSGRGHAQATVLARYLQGKHFEALYASPMKRVQQTLAPLLTNGAPKPIVVPELREVDFGDWTGLGWSEVQRRFGISPFRWLEQLENETIPNAESARSLRARIEPRLRQILETHPGQPVALICHGGVIRMILAILFGWPLSQMVPFEIDYTSITQVSCLPHKTTLELLNFTPWRELRE
jgi:broad specificity phosphatase PhoE